MLSQDEKDEVINRLRVIFSDITYFPDVDPKLRQAIDECDRIELSFANVKNFARRFYETGRYETEDEKKKWREIQWIFATCCVLIVSYQDRAKSLFWKSVDELMNAYPMFAKLADKDELELLLKFRNMLVAATLVLNPRLNKELIIYVAGRLEGTQRRYITGKGQRDAVSMRVRIYEQEGQIVPEVRPYRSNPEKLNEKRNLSPSDIGKPKKKRQEFQKMMLPNTNMNDLRGVPGAGKLPPVGMGLMNGQNSELPPRYFLSSGGIYDGDRETAVRNGAAYNALTPSHHNYVYHGGPGSVDLSELTTDSQVKVEYEQGVRRAPPSVPARLKKEQPEGQERQGLEDLLALADSADHPSMRYGVPRLNHTAHTPFPSLNMTSPFRTDSLLPMPSGLLPNGDFSDSSLSMYSTFPSQRPWSCATDVLLDRNMHNQPSFSESWSEYIPYSYPSVGTFGNLPVPTHSYRTGVYSGTQGSGSVDLLRDSQNLGATTIESASNSGSRADLHTLAAIAAEALSGSSPHGLQWQP